jgi:hypothetical protein
MNDSERINVMNRSKDKERQKRFFVFMFIFMVLTLGVGSYQLSIQKNLGKSQQINFAADTVQVENLSVLQGDVAALNNKINAYSRIVSSTPSADVDRLTARVIQLESKEQALSDTILMDADKALTASFLREKQKEDENAIAEIKLNQAYLSQRIDSLEITLVAVPLASFVLTILVTGITAVFKWKKK